MNSNCRDGFRCQAVDSDGWQCLAVKHSKHGSHYSANPKSHGFHFWQEQANDPFSIDLEEWSKEQSK